MTSNTKCMLRQLLDLTPEQQQKEFDEIDAFLKRCEKYGTSYSGYFDPDLILAGRIFHRIIISKK